MLYIKDTNGQYIKATSEDITQEFKTLVNARYMRGAGIDSPKAASDLFVSALHDKKHEVFCVLFLDSQNRVIEFAEMFNGTIDAASVYPRTIAQKALELNASAVILGHNHPSGNTKESKADIRITDRIKECLSLFDIRTLDHIIVGGASVSSFAEKGLI